MPKMEKHTANCTPSFIIKLDNQFKRHRKLGNANWDVSEIGFGGWALGGQWDGQDDNDSVAALNKAIDRVWPDFLAALAQLRQLLT